MTYPACSNNVLLFGVQARVPDYERFFAFLLVDVFPEPELHLHFVAEAADRWLHRVVHVFHISAQNHKQYANRVVQQRGSSSRITSAIDLVSCAGYPRRREQAYCGMTGFLQS